MGTIEEVTRSLFFDKGEQPNFLAAITSYKVYSEGLFWSVYTGLANINIRQVKTRGDNF